MGITAIYLEFSVVIDQKEDFDGINMFSKSFFLKVQGIFGRFFWRIVVLDVPKGATWLHRIFNENLSNVSI